MRTKTTISTESAQRAALPPSGFFSSIVASSVAKSLCVALLWLASGSAVAGLPIQHWQSASGAQVYFVENHDLPILDVSVNFAAGSSRDQSATPGMAALAKSLLPLGAGGLAEDAISNRLADIGATLGGDFDADRASIKLRTLSSAKKRVAALDLLALMLQQPDFPQAVLEREKARWIAGLREAETQPESISDKAFNQLLYGNHPYALEHAVTPESVAAIQREQLVAFYQQHYTRGNAVVALIGDISRAQAEQVAEQLTAPLPQGAAVGSLPPVALPAAPAEKRIVHHAAQSHILLGYPGMKRIDPDYFPLYVGNYILGGGGFVSRLTEEVREKRGLVYSVYSYFAPMQEAGSFQIGLQTKKEQTEEALKVVRDTLHRFVQKGVTEKELKAAKDNLTGGFALRLDSNAKVLDYLSVIGFYGLPLTWLDDYVRNVNRVTAKQINDAFQRRVRPENMVTVIVGDPALQP